MASHRSGRSDPDRKTATIWGWRTGSNGTFSRSPTTAPWPVSRQWAQTRAVALRRSMWVSMHCPMLRPPTASGATVDTSHTVLSGDERGRLRRWGRTRTACTSSPGTWPRRRSSLKRGTRPADRGLDHATRAARSRRRPLADGPVRLVTEELPGSTARPSGRTAAERWEQTASGSTSAPRIERRMTRVAVLRDAEATAVQVRAGRRAAHRPGRARRRGLPRRRRGRAATSARLGP